MIIVISDTHDYFNLIEKLKNKYKDSKIDAIIHCGDVVDFTLFSYLKALCSQIYYVKGNNDRFSQENIEKLKILKINYSLAPFEFEIDDFGHFVIMHEPYYIEEYKYKKYINYIIYGHTHIQKIENTENKKILNPGSLGKFLNRIPQYALLEKNKVILKKI